MIAVIGRRRVGKTFLIRSFFAGKIDFEITGIHNGTLSEQMQNFAYHLDAISGDDTSRDRPQNWLEAFYQLSVVLEAINVDRKLVVFIDELPWLAAPRSGFMRALESFWNSWAVKKNIVVILCGSAASWMTRKLIHNKGGLHNRITRHIHLKPFTLEETESYLQSRHVMLDRYQILQVYMITGGIPQYLKGIEPGQSAAQTVDRLCFEPQGILVDEFTKLYASLFDRPENHVKIVRVLGNKRKGLTRKQVVEATKMTDGGSITRLLEELETSGFITSYVPFGKQKKEKLYRLTDEYSLFYLEFMEGKKAGGQGTWLKLSDSHAWKSWSGYAFENICLKHIMQIKMALGIQGIYSESSSFYFAGNEERAGLQVDLLIDRKDHVINLCEIKFYDGPYSLGKDEAMNLRQRMTTFREVSGTRKQIALTLITAFGLQHNAHSLGLVQQEISMEPLFVAG